MKLREAKEILKEWDKKYLVLSIGEVNYKTRKDPSDTEKEYYIKVEQASGDDDLCGKIRETLDFRVFKITQETSNDHYKQLLDKNEEAVKRKEEEALMNELIAKYRPSLVQERSNLLAKVKTK